MTTTRRWIPWLDTTYRSETVLHHGHDHMLCPWCERELCDAPHDQVCSCRDRQGTEHPVFYCDSCRDMFPRDWKE